MWFAFYGLPNVEVKNKKIYSIGRVVSITRPNRVPMLIRLDGIDMDPGILQYLQPADVEGIEIFNPGSSSAIYGNDGYWGVVEITTKRGGTDYIAAPTTNLNSITVTGLSDAREFYSPAYDKPAIDNAKPDLRSTIYWQPNILTDQDGKAAISFYTADEPGVYNVVAEGLNGEGKLVRKVFSFTVN